MTDPVPISALPLFAQARREEREAEPEPPFWKKVLDRAESTPPEHRGIVPADGAEHMQRYLNEREAERAALRAFNAAHPERKEPDAPYVHGSATSRAAAVAISPKISRQGRWILRHLYGLEQQPQVQQGATDHELEREYRSQVGPVVALRPRRVRLRDDLLVEDSGETRASPAGRQAAVWVLTEAGRAAAAKDREGST